MKILGVSAALKDLWGCRSSGCVCSLGTETLEMEGLHGFPAGLGTLSDQCSL